MKVVAKALIQNLDGDYLLLYRGMTHPNFPGHLDLPGGETERDENWPDAVTREVKEEAGIEITSEMLQKVFEKKYPDVIHVLFIAKLHKNKPDITLSWEHSGFEWIAKNNLTQRSLPVGVDRYYLDVLNYLKTST